MTKPKDSGRRIRAFKVTAGGFYLGGVLLSDQQLAVVRDLPRPRTLDLLRDWVQALELAGLPIIDNSRPASVPCTVIPRAQFGVQAGERVR